ncbi:MAG: helix-turn-helix domain-containing protein [Betaproteobacteria bacterium]|nr:helix-turn-helix domain-containing protein [Betaproteobacteria bacterium]
MLRSLHNFSSLREYLDTLPHGGAKALAKKVGISRVYLAQLASRLDGRVASPELCVRIERATLGRVSRPALRPDDWRDIWPELIDAEHPWPAKQEAA